MNNYKVKMKKIMVLLSIGILPLMAKPHINVSSEFLSRIDGEQFDANRIISDISNTGMIVDYHPTGHSGMEWPAGAHTYSNFQSGIWFSGMVNGAIRTATAEYSTEFLPGEYGGDSAADEYQIYKVNKSDLADPLSSVDFQNWPAHRGAPWVDNDGDGVYSPLPAGTDHPEFIGDQVIFYTMTDGDASSHTLYNTSPLGIEVRVTMWGYNRPDAFGDMMFVKMQAFNKGDNEITDMFVGLWDDPDLGDAGDDFVGCDTALSLGYCYNDGSDNEYGDAAPALGYDFFQASVPSPDATSSAFAFGKIMLGYEDLPMSSFVKYINGDEVYYDPETSQEVYNYMSGLKADGSAFVNSATGEDSKFVHPCDPNIDTGTDDDCWVDGDDHDSADRRFLMNVGPFTFPANDSLEVVFGIIHAQANDALSSVTLLKQVDQLAQLAYDIQFALPESPPSPVVNATATFEQIILTWDGSAESYTAEDKIDLVDGESTYFEFEGYNIWQMENLSGTGDKVLLATYDAVNGLTEIYDDVFDANYGISVNVPVQLGSDSGLKHWLSVSSDKLNGGSPLMNDREYYFSVNAYGYNPEGIPKTLESADNIFGIRPQNNNALTPQVELGYSDFEVAHTGNSDGSVSITVVDPFAVTGHDYKIYFEDYLVDWATGVELGYAEGPDCDGEYVLAGESPLHIEDCSGACWSSSEIVPIIGDGTCDDGTSDSGIDVNCAANRFDDDDCNTPAILGACYTCEDWTYAAYGDPSLGCIYDCALVCVPMDVAMAGYDNSWNGDGGCDDGTYDLDLTCAELDADSGDCAGGARSNNKGIKFIAKHNVKDNSGLMHHDDTYNPDGFAWFAWHMLDETTGDTIITNQTIQGGYDGLLEAAAGITANVVDGLEITVNGPANGIHGIYMVHDGETSHEDWSDLPVASALQEHVWMNYDANLDYLKNSNGGYYFATQGGGEAASEASYYERVFRGGNFDVAIPNDFEMRFTESGSKAWMAYTTEFVANVPFELWNIGDASDPADDFQMIAWVYDTDGTDTYTWSGDLEDSGAENDPGTDWVYWRNPTDTSPGTAGYDACAASADYGYSDGAYGTEVMARTVWNNWNGYGSTADSLALASLSDVDPANWTAADTTMFRDKGWFFDSVNSLAGVTVEGDYAYGTIINMPSTGSVYRWITNKPNSYTDQFTFSTSAAVATDADFSCDDVNVWPNPYFGQNVEELNAFDLQIHFTDLPETATISIYNLNGVLVRKLDHTMGQNEIWDINNSFGIPVASGMYIAHVDTDACQAVLKLAIIASEQRLDRY